MGGYDGFMAADYHLHTHLCGHAEGEPRAYVERALELGLQEMGFSDHLPMITRWQPGYSMRRDELEGYVATVQSLAREYSSSIKILLGIEADYFVGFEPEIASLLAAYPFDYVIGSVHFLTDGLPFDHPDHRRRYAELGADHVFVEVYELIARAAESGLFTVIGHFDLPKKFGDRPRDEERVAEAVDRALRAISRAGMAIELNTSGWRKPVGEAYPALDILARAAEHCIPLVFGSDAHRPGDVGASFDRAQALAREVGYTDLLRLSTGRLEPLGS